MICVALLEPRFSATVQAASAGAADCKIDGEIAAPDRFSVDALSLAIVRNMLEGNDKALLGQLSKAALAVTPPASLKQYLKFLLLIAPYQNIHVIHTYLIAGQVGSGPLPKMICGRSLKDPGAIALSVVAVARQFHIEVTAHTINNDWSISIWLIPEEGVLKAQSAYINPTAISGRTSLSLRVAALEQVSRGHQVNAMLLYRAAEGVASRGPDAIPIWRRDLDKESNELQWQQELNSNFGETWRFADQTFSINDFNVVGVGGNLELVINRYTDHWLDDISSDTDNRLFIMAVIKEHPEFADSFAGIFVKAVKPDKTGGFGTVYEFGKGFTHPIAADVRHQTPF